MTITIRTNNVPRPTIDAYELTDNERKEFDYLKWDKIDAGEDSATFFRFKGQLYDLGNSCVSSTMKHWQDGMDTVVTVIFLACL